MLFRKPKLKKVYDEQLIALIQRAQDELNQAKAMEELSDDYDLAVTTKRQIAESTYFYLFKEARIRKILIRP
ncbi:MAG TPA: YaaL family protein [Metalysinibacillus jejuensis]|uniref:YaaL family protein n=1 Tax=Metalysinibacillus jejuensis TaxID=914327 RepID=A0A921NB70_9BACL|nr:YaaL family protein [Metalysinibacillus jejuensis]HJH11231.1 YaaL family protein [Metalysinibacillus jejuensis]